MVAVQRADVHAAIIPESKLRDYLLSPAHPVGRYKAAFFRKLGYREVDWKRLKEDIRSLLLEPGQTLELTEYGCKFTTSGRLKGPNGRTAGVTAVWIILSGEHAPRFVTAYPED